MDAQLAEAVFVGKLLLGITAVITPINGALAVAAFFRRQPPIDQTITALIQEFNKQLQERALNRDLQACEARHAQHVRDLDARFQQAILAVESRMERRFGEIHEDISAIRQSQEEIIHSLRDLYRDGGWTRGKLEESA